MKIEENGANSRLAKLEAEVKVLFIKTDKMDKLMETVSSLATDVRVLAEQIKQMNEMFKEQIKQINDMFKMIINKYDDRLKTQGEKIGKMPTHDEFKNLSDRVNAIEKKPARRVEKIAMKVAEYVIVGAIAYFAIRIFEL